MSNDSMGNLEKLGILVIVILVVVVGVVAITPSNTLFGPDGTGDTAELPQHPDDVAPLPLPDPVQRETRPPSDVPPVPDLPAWPPLGGEKHADAPPPSPRPDVVQRDEPPQPPEVLPEPEPAPSPPVAPRFREVTVKKGDNLWRIAERELGDGGKWKVLAAANPSVDPDRLREGQALRVPTGSGSESAAVREPSRSESPAGGAARTYVVQRGDTPMGLSQRFYGTVKHHGMLLSHNGIADENGLMAGMTIEVPAVPETSANLAPRRSSSAPAAPTDGGEGRWYTVRRGETLADIARDQLGKTSRWREIAELNGIADPRTLGADTRIRLPD